MFIFMNFRMEGDGSYSGVGEAPARNPQNSAAQKRLQQTQAKVDEASNIIDASFLTTYKSQIHNNCFKMLQYLNNTI
jgi:hypothetical protein